MDYRNHNYIARRWYRLCCRRRWMQGSLYLWNMLGSKSAEETIAGIVSETLWDACWRSGWFTQRLSLNPPTVNVKLYRNGLFVSEVNDRPGPCYCFQDSLPACNTSSAWRTRPAAVHLQRRDQSPHKCISLVSSWAWIIHLDADWE